MSSEGGSVVEILGGHHHVEAFPALGASIDHGVTGSRWIVRWRVVHEVRVAAAFHAYDDTGQTHRPSLPDCVPDSLSARGRAYHPVMDEDLQLARNPLLRILYAVLGLFFLGLGIVGYIVPVIPGTVNLLVALWFFSLSSERMHRWMLSNKYFGKSLRDYKAGLGIPRRIKAIAIFAIVLSVGLSVVLSRPPWWITIPLLALGAYGVWYIWSRPTREVVLALRDRDEPGALGTSPSQSP